jgi:CII-binding regulator of phage lambda lysogenization HflD
MNKSTDIESKLAAISTNIQALAQSCQGDSLALLALLRCLEALHREIREGVFQESLPDSRHGFHALLKDIESEGGWPYIERMKLQALLANWFVEDTRDMNASTTDAQVGDDWQPKSD